MNESYYGECWGNDGPLYLNLNGRPVERTPMTHPYSYDEFVIFKSERFEKTDCMVYHDRMMQWSGSAFSKAVREVWPDKPHSQMFSGKKPADFAPASHSHTGYIEKPASPVSGNFVAFDGTTGAVKDSGKKAADFAAASHSHTGYAEVKIFQNVTVAASAWANSSTYAG